MCHVYILCMWLSTHTLPLQGNLVAGFPGQVDEGVIEVVKQKKGIFGMFRKESDDFGGPLRPDYLP